MVLLKRRIWVADSGFDGGVQERCVGKSHIDRFLRMDTIGEVDGWQSQGEPCRSNRIDDSGKPSFATATSPELLPGSRSEWL